MAPPVPVVCAVNPSPAPNPIAGVPEERLWLIASPNVVLFVTVSVTVILCAALKAKLTPTFRVSDPNAAVIGEVGVMPWITVALVHCAIWPLVGVPVFETLPPPAGVAHTPSPRKNVLLLADVPLFIWLVAMFPAKFENAICDPATLNPVLALT